HGFHEGPHKRPKVSAGRQVQNTDERPNTRQFFSLSRQKPWNSPVTGRQPKQNIRKAGVLSEGPAVFRMELGERIRWLLDRFGSRTAAAETAGVTPEHLASYIAGRAKPPFELIARLARVQNVSLDWLASGEGERVADGEPEGFVLIAQSSTEASSGPGSYARDDEERQDIAFSRAWLAQRIRVPEERLIVVFNRGGANAPDIGDGDAMLVDT